MRLNLSKKIIITIEFCVLFATITVGISSIFFLRQRTETDANEKLSIVSDLKGNYIKEYLNLHILQIENSVKSKNIKIGLIDLLQGKKPLKGLGILDILTDGIVSRSGLLDLSVINNQGVVISSTNKQEEGKIKSNEAYFLDAIKKTTIKSFTYDISTKQIVTIISSPIIDDAGNFVGVLAEKINNIDLNKLMADRSGLGLTGETFLINSFNFVMTDLLKEPNSALKKTIFLPQINSCLAKNSNYYYLNDYHGDKVFGYARWIPEIQSCLVTKIDESEVMKPIWQIVSQTIIFVLGLLLFTLFIGYISGQLIIKPLVDLKDQTLKIKEGNLDILIETKSKDEVGDLAASFNSMLVKLRNFYKNLENEVKERTIALNEKVSLLAGNNIELEDSKKAIVNLIEDIEDEKIQIEETIKTRTKELSNEKSRLISSINSLSFGFIIASMDGRVVLSNPVLLTILDITKTPEFISELKDFFGDFDFIDSYNQCVATQETIEINEVVFGNKFLRLFYAPIINVNKIIDYVVTIEDITEAKIIERSKDEFFAVASHELRTPLTAIRGNADMILDMYSDQIPNTDIKEMLKDINLASIRLIDIVNDFLEVTRLEQGKMEMKFETFELPELVNKVVKNLSGIADKKNVSINYNSSIVNLPKVFADKNRTEEVLINVISNAIKFTNGGNVFITNEINNNFVVVRVADTGMGIDIKNQSLLFRKFQQANDKILIRNDSNSTGLGLYISKLILLDMGGDIMLEKSEPGVGSTFSFTLPVAI